RVSSAPERLSAGSADRPHGFELSWCFTKHKCRILPVYACRKALFVSKDWRIEVAVPMIKTMTATTAADQR
ncbi:MAG: hypothetical protein QGI17_08925, partial [Arenicellales bacterium]|nr:hypothetical protein [Arenicellales bacterium]